MDVRATNMTDLKQKAWDIVDGFFFSSCGSGLTKKDLYDAVKCVLEDSVVSNPGSFKGCGYNTDPEDGENDKG